MAGEIVVNLQRVQAVNIELNKVDQELVLLRSTANEVRTRAIKMYFRQHDADFVE